MQFWYEEIRYRHAVYCPDCRQLLARRAGISRVLDPHGNRIEVDAVGNGYDDRADYLIRCDCGSELELQSPEDVEQLKSPETALPAPYARPVVRLT